jgi:hypothetical protein
MKISLWNIVKALLSITIIYPIFWFSSMFWAIVLPSRSNPGSDVIISSSAYWPCVWWTSVILLILLWFIIWKIRIHKKNNILDERTDR